MKCKNSEAYKRTELYKRAERKQLIAEELFKVLHDN